MTDRLARDVRVALRGFRRSPTFAVTAVLILGVGIGMTVAIWAVFNAVLLRPPPVSDPDRIVIARILDNGGNELAAGHEDLVEMRQISRTLRAITAYDIRGAINFPMTDGDRPLPLAGAQVDGQFFDVLGVRPVIGRLLHADDDSLSHVMVLSYDAWQRYFEGDPAVVGRRFRQPTMGGHLYRRRRRTAGDRSAGGRRVLGALAVYVVGTPDCRAVGPACDAGHGAR